MDSIFDNLLPLLLILAYIFSSVFRKKKEEDEPAPTAPSHPIPDDETDSLREEIKRRFQERAGQLQEESDPTYSDESPPVPVPQPTPPVKNVSLSYQYDSGKAFLLQQARLTELRRKTAEIYSVRQAHADTPYGIRVSRPSVKAMFMKHLGSPKSLREAIILMEILGPPISLRKSGEELRPN